MDTPVDISSPRISASCSTHACVMLPFEALVDSELSNLAFRLLVTALAVDNGIDPASLAFTWAASADEYESAMAELVKRGWAK